MAEDEYFFERLAHDITVRHVLNVPNIPATAADLAMKIITTGVAGTKFRQDPAKTVATICAGVLTGWKPVGSGGQYEVTNIDLIFGGKKNGSCDNGPQSAESAGPFGVMVWGLDSASSYAYTAGGNVAPINTVVVQPVPN